MTTENTQPTAEEQAAAAAAAAAEQAAKDKAAQEAADAANRPAITNKDDSRPNVDKENELITYEFTPTGDAGLDLALAYVGNLGFSADHPAMQAAGKGEFGELDKALAAMGDKAKGYKQYLTVAQGAFTRAAEAAKAKTASTLTQIHAVVGGEESWKQIAAFVGEHADDGERKEIEAAFAAGGTTAKAMASHLAQLYANSKGTQFKPAAKADATGQPGGGAAKPMTTQEYAREYARINRESKGNPASHADWRALQARRPAAR